MAERTPSWEDRPTPGGDRMSGTLPTNGRSQAGSPSVQPRRRIPMNLRLVLLIGLAVGSFLAAYGVTRHRRTNGPRIAPPGMRWIPAGEFTMGTASALGWPDERPPHQVRVDGFWIDEHEVTNAQFR